jgi:tetratricopeptide (TPR) repeat protein
MKEPTPHSPQRDSGSATPLVLIPVTAEDVAREKRRKVLIWLAVAVVVVAAAWYVYQRSADPVQAQRAYDAGLRLMKTTRYEQAILNFDRAVDLKPDLADAYRMRARAYVALYNPQPAIRDFSKLAELLPRDATALVERGSARLDMKDYASAIKDADGAIGIDPELGRAYNLRATARRASGDPKGAVADFSKAVELDPSLDNYFQRAATYQLLGEHELAIADFNKAVAFDPQQPHLYFARAESKAAVGDTAGAQEDIRTGRKLDGW